MAPRPTWKGYLKLSLVSCPVALYPATSSRERVSFHIINRKSGNRVRYHVVDAESEAPVPEEDRVKGYEAAKGHHILVEDEDFEAIKLESTHTIDIERFVPRKDVDELYLSSPYYLTPDDKIAEEAFSVIRDAMVAKGMAGIARVVMFRRERLLLLEPRGKGLLATTLRYDYEVRKDSAYFEEIPELAVPQEMLEIAQDIIARKSGAFEPTEFKDRYEEALVDLIRAKQAGRPPPVIEAAKPATTVNLLDALRRSLASEGGREERAPARAAVRESSRPPAREVARAAPAKLKAAAESTGAKVAVKRAPKPSKPKSRKAP